MTVVLGIVRRATALLGVSAIALGGALVATSAEAQTTSAAPAAATAELDTIVVTARKVSENLQNVPVAVTVLTGNDLRNFGIQQVSDLGNFTPGLVTRQAQSTPTALTITLRGQVQTDILVTLDPSVGTYVDGVYWARAYGLNSNLLDISSVQVLKGPQGTLFGRNTTGGALLFNTNDPKLDEFSGQASFTYGRFNEIEATGVVNIPIISDKIALRIAATRLTRDGYTTNSLPDTATTALAGNTVVARGPFLGSQNGVKLDNRDRWNGRVKLLIQPTETFSLLFSGEYFDSDETGPSRQIRLATNAFNAGLASPTNPVPNSTYSVANTAGLFVGLTNGFPPAAAGPAGIGLLNGQAATLAANPNIAANNERPYNGARTYTYGMTATVDTLWGDAKLILAHRDVRAFSGIDLEGSQYAVHFTEGQQRIKQDSGEIVTTGRAFNDAVDFAVGAFVFHESGFDQSISVTVPALNPTTSHFYGLIDNVSIGGYGQATWRITDRLSATGGLRYSVDDKELETRNNNYVRASNTTICSVVPVAPFVGASEVVGPAQCALRRKDSFGGFSYTAGLDYKITDDILVYAKASRGFRSGGQNLRAPSVSSFLPFEPEFAYAYEIGFKGEFLDRRLRLNAAAYTTDVNDIQRSTLISTPPIPPSTVPGTATILSNAGKARFRGLELEAQALLFEGFRLSGTYAYVDPKYVSFSDLSGDRSFERFVGIAKHQFSLAADYSREISETVKINLNVNYAWRGDSPTSEYNFPANPQNDAIINATTADALGLLGARASVAFGNRFELAVFGRNITDQRKFVQNLLVAPLGYITGLRQEPATYGVTGSVKF
ncbi:MAG: TonB-dependent receptor [Sphingomonas sp.]